MGSPTVRVTSEDSEESPASEITVPVQVQGRGAGSVRGIGTTTPSPTIGASQITVQVQGQGRGAGSVRGFGTTMASSTIHRVSQIPVRGQSQGINPTGSESGVIGDLVDCDFFEPYGVDETVTVFSALFQMVESANNDLELCTNWGSMLCCIVPGVKQDVIDSLRSMGVKANVKPMPIRLATHNPMTWPAILVTFGCSVLVLMKEFVINDEETYISSMSATIQSLKASVGYDPSAPEIVNPFNFKKANTISAMMGFNAKLRLDLIECLRMDPIDPIALALSDCLMNELKGSRMEAYSLVRKWLYEPGQESRVLKDPRVAREVSNMAEAYEAVSTTPSADRPLFMHLAPPRQQLKLMAAVKFPTLLDVAKELENKKRGMPPTTQTSSSKNRGIPSTTNTNTDSSRTTPQPSDSPHEDDVTQHSARSASVVRSLLNMHWKKRPRQAGDEDQP